MAKAVDVAERNMARFGLTQAEISNRRKWVMQTRKKVTAPTDQWRRELFVELLMRMAIDLELSASAVAAQLSILSRCNSMHEVEVLRHLCSSGLALPNLAVLISRVLVLRPPCEGVMASLEGSHKVSSNVTHNGSVPERWKCTQRLRNVCAVAVQCEGIMASLEGSHKVSFDLTDNGSVTGRLGAAAAQENDKYINSEGDRQQLLIR